MTQVKQISDNETYLLIKYIKSVLWRVAKRLSYVEDARCLRVKSRIQSTLCRLQFEHITDLTARLKQIALLKTL